MFKIMENDFFRSVSSRAARRNQHQRSQDNADVLLYGGKLSREYTLKTIWKKGFIRLVLTGGIIWMLLILTVLLFHVWSCQSTIAFFADTYGVGSTALPLLSINIIAL